MHCSSLPRLDSTYAVLLHDVLRDGFVGHSACVFTIRPQIDCYTGSHSDVQHVVSNIHILIASRDLLVIVNVKVGAGVRD